MSEANIIDSVSVASTWGMFRDPFTHMTLNHVVFPLGALSWLATLGPWAWLLLGVAAGIVALYFLKLRREPVSVSSTYLWGKTIQDLHVNSLLQRLRRSLLLLLQLLILACAAIAVFRPGIRDESDGQERLIFLLDRSASMQAVDLDDGVSRFDKAKELIRGQIGSMSDEQTAMLIAFDDRAETVQSFTSDRSRLLQSLSGVSVSNAPTDMLEALRAADGLANPRRSSQVGDLNDVQVADASPAELLIYSDGAFQAPADFNLGNLVPRYVAVGRQDVLNLAITEFSTQQDFDKPGIVQVFGTVANLGTESGKTEVTLEMDGELLDADLVSLEPGEEKGLAFEISANDSAFLTLTLNVMDDLAVDNRAYAGLTPSKRASILVISDGNAALEVGLETDQIQRICDVTLVGPSFLKTDAYRERMLSGEDDLVIFDRCQPAQMPKTNTFFIGSIPPASVESAEADSGRGVDESSVVDPEMLGRVDWGWQGDASPLTIIDINRTHPLLRYLDLFSVLVFSGRALETPEGATELLAADIGTVMAVVPREGYQDLVLGFPIVSESEQGESEANTNWFAERSWPVFVFNVLRTLGNASETTAAGSYAPGAMVRGRLNQAAEEMRTESLRIETSSGRKVGFVMRDALQFETVDTREIGAYEVRSQDQLLQRFAINLFNEGESTIAVSSELTLGYEDVEAGNAGLVVRREYWRLILLLMLALILAEWWLYNRRMM
ncbi:MAG: vWA domain-containing protein [Rubripirellula sp.]